MRALSERDETAEVCRDAKGNPEPDPELRDYENVPLKEDIHAYFDARGPAARARRLDRRGGDRKTGPRKVGYEIPFNRHFYKYVPPRPLEEIEADIKAIEKDIMQMLAEVTGSSGA